MIAEADKKREQILQSALKRFSHFGIQKTTMSEIADDLTISKPLLYYYFPDKTALIRAAAEKITGEYLAELSQILNNAVSAETGLNGMIDCRYGMVKKYFMMHIGEPEPEVSVKDQAVKDLMVRVRYSETTMLSDLFTRHLGIKSAAVFASLFLDILMGLRLWLLSTQPVRPDESAFESLFERQRQAAQVFINGIKKRP